MQTEAMAPFRELLSSKTSKAWYWDEAMTDLFNKSKEEIVSQVSEGVRTFEKGRPTILSTDWSRTGVGFTLTQKHCACPGNATPLCGPDHWKLVYAGSRFTRGPETRYAPIEGEALAVAFGLNSCKYFILGCQNLILAVDHKPLIKILNNRSLESISNPRLVQLKEKTLRFQYKIVHVPGKLHAAPDHLSRFPAADLNPTSTTEEETTSSAHASHRADAIESISWDTVKREASVDEECVTLAQVITEGFPLTKVQTPDIIRQFWQMRDELYVIDGVPMKNGKILIPRKLRAQVLEGLHIAHQGTSSMLANARQRFFWPGLDSAVKLTRAQCSVCHENCPSQKAEPEITSPDPEIPFQQSVIDFCVIKGHHFAVYADRLSGWVEVAQIESSSFTAIKPTLLRWFRTFGVPEELSTDGGPPFNGHEFRQFLDRWTVNLRLASAYYPQSNGRAEVAVKTAKRILSDNISPSNGNINTEAATLAMLTHRNTPSQGTNIPPAVMLYGSLLKDHLPSEKRCLRNEWRQIISTREQALSRRVVIPSQSKPLEELQIGDVVQVQNQHGNRPKKWSNTGQITEVLPNRQYRVIMDGSRRTSLRNRRFLKPIDPICRQPRTFPALAPQQISPATDESPTSNHHTPHMQEATPMSPQVTPNRIRSVPPRRLDFQEPQVNAPETPMRPNHQELEQMSTPPQQEQVIEQPQENLRQEAEIPPVRRNPVRQRRKPRHLEEYVL